MSTKPIGEIMKSIRMNKGLTVKQMALRCDISESLMDAIENGGVTHPVIADKIGKAYGLSKRQTEMLIPENQNPNGEKYEPDKFKLPKNIEHLEAKELVNDNKYAYSGYPKKARKRDEDLH